MAENAHPTRATAAPRARDGSCHTFFCTRMRACVLLSAPGAAATEAAAKPHYYSTCQRDDVVYWYLIQ